MRRTALLLILLFLASCSPQPARVAEPTGIPTPTVVPAHAPEIRFALIGEPKRTNVWQLFDETGATYTDYALRSEYWPRLYHLAPPDFTFEPLAANGMPSEVIQEGDLFTATVSLRTDLKWTDGSSFTAEDAAFTVNAALAFELGYDWSAYYPREYLDHAEAANSSTVKFYFKQKPNVGVWQYGVLQGPIVQKAFWKDKIEDAENLLPDDSLRADIEQTRADLATVQRDVADLSAQALALQLSGKQNRILDSDLKRKQNEQIYVQSNLDKLLEEYAAKIKSAQDALYKVSDESEPVLGTWIPSGSENGQWTNEANPDFPFAHPNFDRAVYRFFENEEEAVTAFQNGEVDFILSPNGLTNNDVAANRSLTYSARFLLFNPLKPQLADPLFRSALSCMLDRNFLAADVLQNHAVPLGSFILSPQWHDPSANDACDGMDESTRVQQTVKLLKDAGYFWAQEPNAENAGRGLRFSNGEAFPDITLIAPSKEDDPLRSAAAYIAERANRLGIPVAVREMSMSDVLYAVYSSRKYDIALVGWRLSEYPSYLCEWLRGETLHLDNSDQFAASCEALGVESDLDTARQSIQRIESSLMYEFPLIPLFTVARADTYWNISYPAGNVLNGWGGLYGAPSYAAPLP